VSTASSLAVRKLRQLASLPAAEAVERCELCGKRLEGPHEHLVRAGERGISCACAGCATVMASGPWRRITSSARPLSDFSMDDLDWAAIGVPVRLCFLHRRSAGDTSVAMALFPGALGLVESSIDPGAFADLAARNPVLSILAPDVEGVLLHHVAGTRRQLRTSIDVCFTLASVVRAHFRGVTGGERVWQEVNAFLDALEGRRHA
jgi:hypothetical protein